MLSLRALLGKVLFCVKNLSVGGMQNPKKQSHNLLTDNTLYEDAGKPSNPGVQRKSM